MPSGNIRVLKFITHFGVGGTERQFVYLTKGLDRSRFDVRVACLARKGPFLSDIEAVRCQISEYTTNSMYSYRTLRGQVRLARDIRRDGVHLVHAYGFYPNLFAIPAARMARRCVGIASVRDLGAFSDRQQLRKLALTTVCRLADCVLANSYAVRAWLSQQGLSGNDIRVIPNGIVVPPPRNPGHNLQIRRELNIDPQAPLICVVGRLARIKGIEFFIQAAAAVASRFPSARFLVVGEACVEPSYRTELENLARALNVGDRVIFAGQRGDVPQLLGEVTVSVLPTLNESFSNSLLESMAAGLPVVATNVGGNPELISDNETGILVPPRDAAALARSMIRLLESPELAHRLGEAARDKVVKQYSLASTLRQTEDLYVSLLERRGLMRYLEADRAICAGRTYAG